MKDKISIAVCDDNISDLLSEVSMIKQALDFKKIEFELRKFSDAVKLLNSGIYFDILFIDVEMEGINGIEAADKIRQKNHNCQIIFVTNYEFYIDEIINKNAFRFWVKPLCEKRLSDGIDAAIYEINRNKIYISVTIEQEKRNINVNEIIYIYAENKRAHIVTKDEDMTVKECFKNIKSDLPKECFGECYANIYVNFHYLVGYTSTSATCADGGKEHTLYMSRRKYVEFRKKFIDWTGDQI